MRKIFYLVLITINVFIMGTIVLILRLIGSGILTLNRDQLEDQNKITKSATDCLERVYNNPNFINEYSGNFVKHDAQESRFIREHFIRVAVFTDKSMSDYYSDDLKQYVKRLMIEVTRLYKHPSIGNSITIITELIMEVDEEFTSGQYNTSSVDGLLLLQKFCTWKKKKRQSVNRLYRGKDFHLAILLKRKQFPYTIRNSDYSGRVMGKIHDPQKSCAVIVDKGWRSVTIIAHEIGHMLNLGHETGKACSGDSKYSSVMSTVKKWHPYFSQWSNCSRNELTNYLDSGVGDCLLDKPNNVLDLSQEPFFGEIYSRNEQCQSFKNRNFVDKPRIEPNGDISCTVLQCYDNVTENLEPTKFKINNVADGTYCNLGKICLYGKCQSFRPRLVPIHGQWGEWKIFANCSGIKNRYIKKMYRECDNPVPKYGGDYCIGERFKHDSCTEIEEKILQSMDSGIKITSGDKFEKKKKIPKSPTDCLNRLNDDSNFINEYTASFPKRIVGESRFIREHFVRVAVFTDNSMSDYYSDYLKPYVNHLMVEVTRLFKHPNIGNSVTITTEFVMKVDRRFTFGDHNTSSVDGPLLLKEFCAWKNKNRHSIKLHHGGKDFHAAVLLTRKQLLNPTQNSFNNGWASGKIHVQQKACAVVSDKGWKSASTIARVIGFMLNLKLEYGKVCFGNSERSSVMHNFDSWHQYLPQWSNCSRNQLTKYLDSGVGDCLLDKPNNVIDLSRKPFFGQIYSRDKQCQSFVNRNYFDLPIIDDNGDMSCTKLQCHYKNISDSTHYTHYTLVADGTACNSGKICLHGKCQTFRLPLKPIHGHWGQWRVFANCAMTKDGYVLKMHRECNNPVPAYGGDYCIGERFNYEHCL